MGATIPAFGLEAPACMRESCHKASYKAKPHVSIHARRPGFLNFSWARPIRPSHCHICHNCHTTRGYLVSFAHQLTPHPVGEGRPFMTRSMPRPQTSILVLGAGYAGLLCATRLARKVAARDVTITLVS